MQTGFPFDTGKRNENVELFKAWAGTTLAFAIAMVGGQVLGRFDFFVRLLLIAAITCGVGFVLHELAHRIVARRYGAEAHFAANNTWLFVSVLIAFGGWFVAAPGAVWHSGTLSKQQSGTIALAGPVTNLVLAVGFLALWLLVGKSGLFATGFVTATLMIGYHINAFLGMFNMIPFGPFDGAKVLDWDRVVFGVTAAVAVLMVFGVPRFFGLPGFF